MRKQWLVVMALAGAACAHSGGVHLSSANVITNACRPLEGPGTTGAQLAVTVRDQQGGPLPGAIVEASWKGGKAEARATGHGVGLVSVSPSDVQVLVHLPGFSPVRVDGVPARAGCSTDLLIDLPMDLRNVDQDCRGSKGGVCM